MFPGFDEKFFVGPWQRTSSFRRPNSPYAPFFETKLWLKSHTPLGRTANLDFLEIEGPEKPSMARAG